VRGLAHADGQWQRQQQLARLTGLSCLGYAPFFASILRIAATISSLAVTQQGKRQWCDARWRGLLRRALRGMSARA
jgi:hypothetical protein